MDSNIERVEQYLRGVRAPDYISDSHRQQLRQQILGQIAERRSAAGHRRRWEVVTALAALICVAGAIGAFIVVKYGAVGQGPASVNQFASEGLEPAPSLSTPDANGTTGVAQAARDLRDMDAAPQKDSTELVQVIESEVNGRLASRMLIPKRQLSSNQMKSLREGDPEIRVQKLLVTLPAAARTEMSQLRRAGKGENLGTQERQMKGRVFLFKRERYTLHDGTTVTLSVGEPKDMRQPLPPVPEGNQP